MRDVNKKIIWDDVDHPLQKLMSRSGSFPLSVAVDLLKKYSRSGFTVLDPFCGKGTTLLAARILGMNAYGVDVAPEAIVCSRAKLVNVDASGMREYISMMKFRSRSLNNVPDNVKVYFHPKTLSQIIYVRDQLIKDSSAQDDTLRSYGRFTLGVLLGILHGHAKYSLSVSSSHVYAMSPEYIKRYAQKHDLKAEYRDVKGCLLEKALRCLSVPLPTKVEGEVKRGSAIETNLIFPHLRNKVDIILTSPPYLNTQTYNKDNWLRIWVLGLDHKELSKQYIQTGSIQKYEKAMKPVITQFLKMLKSGGLLICIAGNVRLRRKHKSGTNFEIFKTGHFLANLCCNTGSGFHLEELSEHCVPSNSRYLHALNKSNGHSKQDLIETVFIARKQSKD